jgi:membrane-bound lytic murein transglycosylase F
MAGLLVTAIAVFVSRDFFRKEEVKHDALRRIRERGYVIALTDQNTLNYFIYRGEPMGYQLVMLQSFARHLGVPLKIIALNDMARLTYYLHHKAADLLALNLPVKSERGRNVHFSEPFGETRMVLVQKKKRKKTGDGLTSSDLRNFPADTVYIEANDFNRHIYQAFYKLTGRKAILQEVSGISQDELLIRVARGKIRYALCQENVAMVYHRYFGDLDIAELAFPLFTYGWATGEQSDSLQTELNEWLRNYKSSGQLKSTYAEYFNNQRIARFMQSDYFSVTGNKLSPFDEAIREHSKLIMWDWRLVASLIYEESNFQVGLKSARNAHGLMQMMPSTAAKFGVDSASTPSRQIAGGIKYLKYLDKMMPEEISDPSERIHFILASYNVGPAKVLAAREKAGKYGKDMNRWNRSVDYYLLRRSRRNPAGDSDTLHSRPVDYKTTGFADDIVERFYHYRNLIR